MIRRDGHITETGLAFGQMIMSIMDRHTSMDASNSYFHTCRESDQRMRQTKSGSMQYHTCDRVMIHISSSAQLPDDPRFNTNSATLNKEYGWYRLIEMFSDPMPIIGYPYGIIREHDRQPILTIEVTYMPLDSQRYQQEVLHPFTRAEAIMAYMWGNWFEPGSSTLRKIRSQYSRVAEKIQQIVPLYIKAEPAA